MPGPIATGVNELVALFIHFRAPPVHLPAASLPLALMKIKPTVIYGPPALLPDQTARRDYLLRVGKDATAINLA